MSKRTVFVEVSCDTCEKHFLRYANTLRRRAKWHKYCSKKCSDIGQSRYSTKKTSPQEKKQWRREYYRKNREKLRLYRAELAKRRGKEIRQYQVEYQKKHREEINRLNREWCITNKEKRLSVQAKYRQTHKDEILALTHLRRAKTKETKLSASEWKEIKAFYNYACLCCGRCEPEILLTPDHIQPLTRDGLNCKENIQPLCRSCNSSKGRKIIDYRILNSKRFKVGGPFRPGDGGNQ